MTDQPDAPILLPLGVPVSAEAVHEVWEAFVTNDPETVREMPQSIEMRTLMAILRWTHDTLSPGPCKGCLK